MDPPNSNWRNILLVDDNKAFREAFAKLLQREPSTTIVAQCERCGEALEVLENSAINLILLDAHLGNDRAIDFVIEAKKRASAARILVVTAGVTMPEASALLRSGIAGILHKNRSRPVMALAIRRVAGGGFWLERCYSPCLTPSNPPAIHNRSPLTDEERQLARFVLGDLSNQEIAGRLCVSNRVVSCSLSRLFKKLRVGTRAKLVEILIKSYGEDIQSY